MPAAKIVQVVTLIKQRRSRSAVQRRAVSQRALQAGAVLLGMFSLAAATLALVALPAYFYLTQGLPSVERLEVLLDPQTGELLLPTRFVDRSGQQVLLSLEPPGGPRIFVAATENPYLADAFVASQDPQFWVNGGPSLFDLNGGLQGIAEKLVARLLLAAEPEGWVKTLRARLLAADAVARYGRAQVLNWTLNSSTFGYWTFGAESAAQLYFGKAADNLSLAESALLAAVAQAPALTPIDAPELAIEYQHLVLASMRTQDLISDAEFSEALAQPLAFSIGDATPTTLAPSFTDLVLEQLVAEWDLERVQLGGLTVVTTMDYALQQETSALLTSRERDLVVLNPASGQILALIGDTARQVHPAESVRLPFIYLNVFALGRSPASLVWDLPNTARFSAADFQGPMTMREALASGYLAPIQEEVAQLSSDRANELFSALGINGGARQANALQLATAYGTLANGGLLAGRLSEGYLQPSAILFVGNAQNRVVLNWATPEFQALSSPELAFLVTDVLADASFRSNALESISQNRQLAIIQANDLGQWGIGYSPQRAVVLWSEAGTEEADQLLVSVLEAAHRGLPVKNWDLPSGLLSIVVCVPSGLLPDEDCPQTRHELFLRGTEPTETDSLFQRVAINSITGQLATVFTPEEIVEERLFLIVPPEAEAWARAAGLEQPPEEYDPVSVLELHSSPLLIAQPAPFSEVSGVVDILGVLAEGTVAFDIQVGQGLRPTEWMVLGEQEVNAQNNAQARWDTNGLSGVWAIQLQAWDEAGIVRRAYAIVTIEN